MKNFGIQRFIKKGALSRPTFLNNEKQKQSSPRTYNSPGNKNDGKVTDQGSCNSHPEKTCQEDT